MNAPVHDEDAERILNRLASSESQQAWTEFLEVYAPLIFHVVKLAECEPDHISDCFLFICEKLIDKQFHRLRRFRFDGRARFKTWLWAVVRNLGTDWHRREYGRHRISRSVARLSGTDQEVFRCVYEQGLTREQALCSLVAHNPSLTMEEVEASCDRIQAVLTPRQLWLLSARRRQSESLDTQPDATHESWGMQIPDPAPNPEAAMVLEEHYSALERALGQLSGPERLLITLRYEQGLTLKEVAEVLHLKDPWVVERRIRGVLDAMREQMPSFPDFRAKTRDASVSSG